MIHLTSNRARNISLVVSVLLLLAAIFLYAKLRPSASVGRAEQIETISATLAPAFESMHSGDQRTKILYSFKNKGPDTVAAIEAEYELLKGTEVIRKEAKVIIWTLPPPNTPVKAGSQFLASDGTSDELPFIKDITSVIVRPTRAWATYGEFTAETNR